MGENSPNLVTLAAVPSDKDNKMRIQLFPLEKDEFGGKKL
jgi:hypothetical protein